ncbi:MarR family transcriptional regulator [Coprococcus catus]|uniref:MarR family transcriptional regulator n=1 Tax=Coprococcus catus TaxID=116085 RepID=A0A3E2XP85_9FIRM|nr:MarR family transcriptional regulator [Coprococcus catus]RGC50336.1 MarR family transcriptional regulator [Coprococcus catus]
MDMDFFDLSFEESLDEQLVNAILDVGRDIRRLFEGKESQSRILMILRLHGAVTQKVLIQILHIQPGSASEILKKMEKAGLIIRVPNEMNRRASDIVLTRQGRSVSEKLIEQRRGRYREMMACLSEDEKVSLFSMLDRMKEDWQHRFRAVPESTIVSGDSSLQKEKERNKISETSSDGK